VLLSGHAAATEDVRHLHKPLQETEFQRTDITTPVRLMQRRGDRDLKAQPSSLTRASPFKEKWKYQQRY